MTSRRTPARVVALTLTLALAATLAACGSDSPSATDTTTAAGGTTGPGSTAVAVEGVEVGKLAEPTALVARPGDDELWAAERAGTIRRVKVGSDGTLTPETTPALDITAQTSTEIERGLLDIEFSPDGVTLYVSHTDTKGNTRVASYAVDGTTVDPASRTVLLAQDQPFPNHNGGNLEVDPDGRLWFGFGDGGLADDPQNRAQDPSTPLGKIVRVDPKGGAPEIVISGVRNPWRFAFDTDKSLWIGDVGQNKTEEIDHLTPSEIEGANLGWSGYEGNTPYLTGKGRRPAEWTRPVFTYDHIDGNCSITGGYVYRGDKLPGLVGTFLFADYCKGDVFAFRPGTKGEDGTAIDLKVHVDQPISFGRDADGEPFVLSQAGTVVRLAPAS